MRNYFLYIILLLNVQAFWSQTDDEKIRGNSGKR